MSGTNGKSSVEDGEPGNESRQMPRDAVAVAELLAQMGIEKYDPRVVSQLMEFSYRYTRNMLQDADDYKSHAGKANIDDKDVGLAIEANLAHSFASPPPKEVMMELAQERNKMPLPIVPTRYGVLLPPERYTLAAPNYHVEVIHTPLSPKQYLCFLKRYTSK